LSAKDAVRKPIEADNPFFGAQAFLGASRKEYLVEKIQGTDGKRL